MGQEIERKFLVRKEVWKNQPKNGQVYRQGYLNSVKERTVRVRIANNKGYLTVKGLSRGATRLEFEYEIPVEDAQKLLDLCEKPLIEKTRYKIEQGNFVWEVDEFFGENEGLILAEIELESEEQAFSKPDWLAEEVTDDPRYFNANLVQYPYSEWADTESQA
jgi:CYTH domain-containing protein